MVRFFVDGLRIMCDKGGIAKGDRQMTITDMIANARSSADKNGEKIDTFWGEYPRVMKLLAAYYGGFNVVGMDNYKRVRS